MPITAIDRNRLWGLQERLLKKNVNSAHTGTAEKRLTLSQQTHLGTLPSKAGEDSIVPVISLLQEELLDAGGLIS